MTSAELQALFNDPATSAAIQNALTTGAVGSTGGNANQVQAGTQAGAFESSGTENQTQNQTQAQQQTGTQVGTTAQNTAGATGVVDTLGAGSALAGLVPQSTATTNATNATLTGVMQQGDPNLQSQVQQAVNNATSGPGMVGAGQSANARAAGYAAADVGRKSQQAQLQAAAQLSGPTAATTMAGAAVPYTGTTTQASNTGTQQTATDSSSLGTTLGSMVTDQSQSGTSTADNLQVAQGNQPTQETQSKGGKVVCTVLVEHGLLSRAVVATELLFFQKHAKKFNRAIIGYYFFGVWLARLALRFKTIAYLCFPVAWGCTTETMRLYDNEFHKTSRKANPFAWLIFKSFFLFTDSLGWALLKFWPTRAQDKITDPVIIALLKKHDLVLCTS